MRTSTIESLKTPRLAPRPAPNPAAMSRKASYDLMSMVALALCEAGAPFARA